MNRPFSRHFGTLMRSYDTASVIELDVFSIGDKSPDYSDKDLIIYVRFGSLEFNWNVINYQQ